MSTTRIASSTLLAGATIALALCTPSVAHAQDGAATGSTSASSATPPQPGARRVGRTLGYLTLALGVGTGVGSGSLAWRLQGGDTGTLSDEMRGYTIGLGVATVVLLGASVTLFAACPPEDPDPGRGTRIAPWGLYLATGLSLVPAVVGLVFAGTSGGALRDPSQHPDRASTTSHLAGVFYGESIATGFFALSAAFAVWSAVQTGVAFAAREPAYDLRVAVVPTPGGASLTVGGWL